MEELVHQEPPRGGFEVIVADGGSTDRTRDIVDAFCERWPNVRLLENPRRLSSAGRNVGAQAARGRYVLFLDGHCSIPRTDYLVRAVELFESTGAACLCRPQPLTRMAEGKWAEAISAARHSPLGHNSGSDIFGASPGFTDPRSAGAAYSRDCFDRLGGYDERFDACEDVEFNHRIAEAGLRSYRHPDLLVAYRPRSSLHGLFRQMVRYGRGRARLMSRHPSAIPWPLVLMTLFCLVLLGALVLGGLRLAGLVTAMLGGIWILLSAAESIRLGGLTSKAMRIELAFCAIHLGLVLGFWRGLPELHRFRPPAPL